MKKRFVQILLLFITFLIFLIFITFVGFSKVSTDKDTYLENEEIVISYIDFRLLRFNSSPSETNLFIYYEASDGLKKLIYEDWQVTWGGIACVDDKVIYGGHPGDILSLVPFSPYVTGTYTWKSTIYEKKNDKEVCEDIKEPVNAFQSKPALTGKYQIKFGKAKQNFEIKKSN